MTLLYFTNTKNKIISVVQKSRHHHHSISRLSRNRRGIKVVCASKVHNIDLFFLTFHPNSSSLEFS